MSHNNGTNSTSKISVAMIVRNCAKSLDKCLRSFAAYPDEIVIVNTGTDENEPGFKDTNEVAEAFGAKIFHFPWVEDFSAARNFSFSKCSNDVVMWVDSDDVIENASRVFGAARKLFAGGEVDCLYMEYLYDFDDRGNCTTILTRERIVNRRNFEWRAPIHEVLCENYRTRGVKMPAEVGRVIHDHKRDDPKMAESLARNLRIIEHHYLPKEQGGLGEYCEERMVFYWANTLMGLGRWEEALRKYVEYIPRSGSQAEIQQALGSASECARLMGKYPEAAALAHQAIERNPNAPTPYWFLAQANLMAGKMELAVHYALMCLERAHDFGQEMVANPKVIFGGSALLAATAKYKQNKIDEVGPLLDIAAKYYGSDDAGIKEMRENVDKAKREKDLLHAYNVLRSVLEAEGRSDDVRVLARAAPKEIGNAVEVARYLPKVRPADKKTVMFLCGGGMPGGWSPDLLKTGMGGSEEAVCYLAKEFVKKGWHVEVYTDCTRQTWEGVEWYPIAHYPGDDDQQVADALVVWRDPMQVLYFGAKAKKTYLWLHDMPNPACWMPDIHKAFDGVFVLSRYHDKVYDFIPAEKKILSANGLPQDKLVPIEALENEPHRMVYASCPTRGLETVLLWWDYIRQAVPDAQLDVYYGFHPTLVAHAKGKDPYARSLAATIDRITKLKDQPGVNWHGFVGHDVLHEGFSKCGLWLYPTQFPEISCITAMKMQAHGVLPVTVNDFALTETVLFGAKLNGDLKDPAAQKVWADKVIELALNPISEDQRLSMAKAARERFDWKAVATQWIDEFENGMTTKKRLMVMAGECYADDKIDDEDRNRIRHYPRNRLDLIRLSE